MLISALCSYYDVLAGQGRVLPDGYSNVKIHFLVALTPDGRIDDIIDWQRRADVMAANGKSKLVISPRVAVMMKRSEKPGIDGNVIEHRPLYIFGLNFADGAFSAEDRTDKAKKSHEAFIKNNLAFLEGLDTPVVNAFRAFMESWRPDEETQNPFLLSLGKAYPAAGFAFCLSGRPDAPLHDDPLVKAKWELWLSQREAGGEVTAQCGITGMTAPIARIHDKIRGVPNGSSMGNTLISCKNPAESSYGREQSYNSNVSELAMKKYTEALNFLMADRRHRSTLDDMTIVHWASSGDERCDDMFVRLAFDDMSGGEADEMDMFLSRLIKDAGEGAVSETIADTLKDVDTNVDFYIAGIKPNSARLAVKFVCRRRFGTLLYNIARHQADIRMREDARPLPLWRIRRELVSPKSKNDAVDPASMAKLLEAIVYGYDYPDSLLSTLIRRIKTDSDDENNSYIKMNDVRMGVLKGCINRKARLSGRKEEIKMALDKQNTNPAYLSGRLFAVLESIQQKASNYSLNRTIRDSYFSSASSRPAAVFPKLMRLSQYHLSKIGDPKYANDSIKEITDLLGSEFPSTLSLVDQGNFMLGYYQQWSYTDRRIKEAKEAKEAKNTQEVN